MRIRIVIFFLLIASSVQAQNYITNASGTTVTNQPITIARVFRDGDLPACGNVFFAQSAGGAATAVATTQTTVLNHYSDTSVKFALFTFVIPSLSGTAPANVGMVTMTNNQSGCNSGSGSGYLTPANMLSTSGSPPSSNQNWNFDAQVKLTGTVNHNISARAILTAASSGNGCGFPANGDIDGYLATSGNLCAYWDAGPVRTCVLLEDRAGRTFDVNTDGNTGTPLHPRFEACFYPQTGKIEVGFTLENTYVSATAANSSRDQTYAYTLTVGNTSPTTIYTQASETVLNSTFWHHMFCATPGTGPGSVGTQNGCFVGILNIDHNWPYMAQSKAFPPWNTNYNYNTTTSFGNGTPSPTSFNSAWTNSLTNKTDAGNSSTGVGFYPGYNTYCGNSRTPTTGDNCAPGSGQGIDNEGAAYYHGPLTTWDIITLISQDPNMLNVVTPGNADAAGAIPYWFREYDTETQLATSSGIPRFFNSPAGNVSPTGRILSINSRVNIDTDNPQSTNGQCPSNFPSEYMAGTVDQGIWGSPTMLDTSHWPEVAFTAYILSGQYAYYEEMLMQAAKGISSSGGGFDACTSLPNISRRQGAFGYQIASDGQRTITWDLRNRGICAAFALDGSPEKAYCLDKLNVNLALLEGSNQTVSSQCDITGTPTAVPYCSGANNAWTYGNVTRANPPGAFGEGYIGGVYGTLFSGGEGYGASNLCPASSNCSPVYLGNSNFMTAYTGVTIGWLNDLGLCPGNCYLMQWVQNFFINVAMDPNGPGLYMSGDYAFPTYGCQTASAPGTCSGTPQTITQLSGAGNSACSGWPANASCNAASGSLYAYFGTWTTWPRPSSTWPSYALSDEGYPGEFIAALTYGFKLTSTANVNQSGSYVGLTGLSGQKAWNTARPLLFAASTAYPSPKWDFIARIRH